MGVETVRSRLLDGQLGRRGLLALGGTLLLLGWGGTALMTRSSGPLPGDPRWAVVALWVAIFGVVAGVALLGCPPQVRINRANLLWVGLNTTALVYTVAAILGVLRPALAQYAYWHVWVLAAVLGFAATGTLLEGEGIGGQLYFTAAGLELSLLFLGLGAFDALRPGLYLLLAVVHPTPLLLDALPADLSPGWMAAVQLGVYAVGLGVVFLL